MAHLVIVGTPWTATPDLPTTRVAAPVAQMRGLLLELTR